MPCEIDLSITEPVEPSGIKIPGFGTPFSINAPIIPLKDNFPENLLELFNSLSLTLPSGILQPTLSVNYGKDIFDSLLNLLDKFMPFLMLYKFFMPILNIIVCILEVLCSLMNPFKLRRAIRRLFRRCIPDFLNMFPIFAIIVMLISLLLLLLALIEYIIEQIKQLIDLILRNLRALDKAIKDGGDAASILAITSKIASVLCIFQNLFVLLSLFTSIFQVIKDILNIGTNIPPCDDSGSSDPDDCCTTDVCPAIVLSNYNRITGILQYNRKVTVIKDENLIIQESYVFRDEGWYLFDVFQEPVQEFRNIIDPYDVTSGEKKSFFPTDGTYSKNSNPRYVPYTVDIKVFYNPGDWGRKGSSRYIIFKDCIVIEEPSLIIETSTSEKLTVAKGVLRIEGGKGFEEDGSIIYGYSNDNVIIPNQATLNNFFHYSDKTMNESDFITNIAKQDKLPPTDGYICGNVDYTFKPNTEYLFSKQLITAGCFPDLALDREVVNQAYGAEAATMGVELNTILNNGFPNTAQTQLEMETAIESFTNNVSTNGIDTLSKSLNASLDKLKNDTLSSIENLINTGVSPCNSKASISDKIQFISKPIKVKVNLNERNGVSITNGAPSSVLNNIAKNIKGYATLGNVSNFIVKEDFSFEADLTSNFPGYGQLTVSFNDNMICNNNIPEDLNQTPSIDTQIFNYIFVDAGGSAGINANTSDGGDGSENTNRIIDQDLTSPNGQPRRDVSDISKIKE